MLSERSSLRFLVPWNQWFPDDLRSWFLQRLVHAPEAGKGAERAGMNTSCRVITRPAPAGFGKRLREIENRRGWGHRPPKYRPEAACAPSFGKKKARLCGGPR